VTMAPQGWIARPSGRTRQFRAPSRPSVAYSPVRPWVDCITDTYGSNLRQAPVLSPSISGLCGEDPLTRGGRLGKRKNFDRARYQKTESADAIAGVIQHETDTPNP